MKNKYISAQSQSIEKLEQALQDRDVEKALQGTIQEPSDDATQRPTPNTTSRTLQTPDFEGDTVPNFTKRVELRAMTMPEFETAKTFLGSRFSGFVFPQHQVGFVPKRFVFY